MYVKIMYYNEKVGGYAGREYTYSAALPLKVGDRVMVPVAGDEPIKRALVTEIDVPESEIADSWRDRIKEIKNYDYSDVQPVR